MGDTKIEWTEKTWNPIRARRISNDERGWYCEHVSEGCRNCYAEKMNRNTYFGNGLEYKPSTLPQVELFLDEKILQQPLHWSTPQNVFPCSMTDLFGRWVKDEWLDKIFQVMYDAKRHIFQCLTKRPERMFDYVSRSAYLSNAPLPNVWLGVSVEDQKTADERIPLLLQTPAAVRWISAEPLLGPVDLSSSIGTYDCMNCGYRGFDCYEPKKAERVDGDFKCPKCGAVLEFGMAENSPSLTSLGWVVAGGESGPKARPMHPDWARSLRDQCVAAGVPFFFKQMSKANWKDYKDFASFPSDLQIREYPNGSRS